MVLLIFALLGAVASVFTGAFFLQKVISSHVHILQKKGLATDFIVADMDGTNMLSDCEDPPSSSSTQYEYDLSGNQYETSQEERSSENPLRNISSGYNYPSAPIEPNAMLNSSTSMYNNNGLSNISADQTSHNSTWDRTWDNNGSERESSSFVRYRDTRGSPGSEQLRYRQNASAPPLTAAQRRELTSLGLL